MKRGLEGRRKKVFERRPYQNCGVYCLWGDTRRIKGAAEKGLFEVMDGSEVIDGKKCLDVISLRVGGVLAKGDAMTKMFAMGTVPSITVDRLAKTAIHKCWLGDPDHRRVLENADVLGEDWAMVNTIHAT
jgi:hypothetical protein